MTTSLTSTKTVLSKLSMNNGRQGREEGWHVFSVITIMAQSGPPDTAQRRACPEAPQELLCTGCPLSPGARPASLGAR